MGTSHRVQGISRVRLLTALAVSLALVAGTTVRAAWAKSGPKECPEMTNPGGGLNWEPSKDPGPDPTSYKVELPTMGRTQPIVRVGIDKDRKMVVPKNARDVAWLDQGPIPGRTKNVVLAGHINYSGQRGAFEGIGRMKKREDIYLVLKNGKKMHFKVAWVCTFPRDTQHADADHGQHEGDVGDARIVRRDVQQLGGDARQADRRPRRDLPAGEVGVVQAEAEGDAQADAEAHTDADAEPHRPPDPADPAAALATPLKRPLRGPRASVRGMRVHGGRARRSR